MPVLRSGGILKFVAPIDHSFVHVNGACKRLTFRNYDFVTEVEGSKIEYPGLVWGASDTRCFVKDLPTGERSRVMEISLNSDKMVRAGQKYEVIADVRNPKLAVEGKVYEWMIQSFSYVDARAGSALDEVTIKGYKVNHVLKNFFYRNEDEFRNPIRNGLTFIPGLFFHMTFPMRIDPGDVIFMEGSTDCE